MEKMNNSYSSDNSQRDLNLNYDYMHLNLEVFMNKKASEELRTEHETIMFALKIMETMNNNLDRNIEFNYNDIIKLLDFMIEFADKNHHGKEEKIYFPELEKIGLKRVNGPIGIMFDEHEIGRGYISVMKDCIKKNGNITEIDKKKFLMTSGDYISLLDQHIYKENYILYTLGDNAISDNIQERLLDDFKKFEESIIAPGKREELYNILSVFEETYLIQNVFRN